MVHQLDEGKLKHCHRSSFNFIVFIFDSRCTDDDEHDTKLSSDESEYSSSSLGDDSDTTSSSEESSDDRRNEEDGTLRNFNRLPTTSFSADDRVDEELFAGQTSGVDNYFNELQPVNQKTVTTTPSDEDEDSTETVSDESSESDLDGLKKHAEEEIPEWLAEVIAKTLIAVKTHPPSYLRLRYEIDGPRRSFRDPLAIDISKLQKEPLSSDQTFWIRLSLVAHRENAPDKTYLHPNILKYILDDANVAKVLDDGTLAVRLTSDDIKKGIKEFPHLSIIKRKFDTYNRELTLYNGNTVASYIRGNEIVTVKEAKKIYKKYNSKASQIVYQLLIKQGETFDFTDHVCVTRKMEETQQSTKRPKESTEDDEEEKEIGERPSRSKSKLTKRKKTSHPSTI
ncbi:unnamed protein product [Adineta steineri]|uniref:Uncharacterized protein n=1 Tax=Adineta steineri TaxID=433720 RepID=A0A814IF55_9BILA|nr:unnamed protein product [Adineta steineri]CAF1129896.1 unnamed protein product [Adineta steineri]